MKESKELMFRDIERFFDPRGWSFFQPFRREFGEFAWTPALELRERDHHLYAKFELPGMKKEEITVTLGDGEITVSGE